MVPLPLFISSSKSLRKPLATTESITLQAGIGKGERPHESKQHVRKPFGKRRLTVERPRRIDIDQRIVGDIDGIGYVAQNLHTAAERLP